MKHKTKQHFFLLDMPKMFLLGLLILLISMQLESKVAVVSYQAYKPASLGAYQGDEISDGGTEGNSKNDTYKVVDASQNGSDLKDNGLPYAIKVNKTRNVVTIYKLGDDGYYNVPVKAMICSVGETGNTPIGVFDLGDRAQWLPLEGDVYGQYAVRITGDILFHSVPYFSQNKDDLEIEEYNKLGKSVSAGCVRLSVVDSKWIYDNCGENTFVEIFESEYDGPMGKPVAAVIRSTGKGNWDPTDPDRENPYLGNVPVIFGAYDREIQCNSDFNILAGISALDSMGEDITNDIKVKGKVDLTSKGIYKVSYSVKDSYGLTGTATANVIVKDDDPPVLVADQKISRIGMYDVKSQDELKTILLKSVTAYDNGKELDQNDICIDYSEIINHGFGKCHVKYCVSDSAGNKSDVVVLTYDVDMEAPTLRLKNKQQGEIRVSKMASDEYMLKLVEVSDNSDNVEVTLSRPLSYIEGYPYTVVYCAKDEFGNVSTLSVTYQVANSK